MGKKTVLTFDKVRVKNAVSLVSNTRGFTLIEVLLAGALITLIVGALVHLGVMSLRGSDSGKRQTIATELTKEAIEVARVKRDEDSQTFFDFVDTQGDGYYSLVDTTFSFVSAIEPSMPDSNFVVSGYDGFYRVVYFDLSDGGDSLLVRVETLWREPGGAYMSVKSATILTKWR